MQNLCVRMCSEVKADKLRCAISGCGGNVWVDDKKHRAHLAGGVDGDMRKGEEDIALLALSSTGGQSTCMQGQRGQDHLAACTPCLHVC